MSSESSFLARGHCAARPPVPRVCDRTACRYEGCAAAPRTRAQPMLSASAYSFRQKSRLAISLSWVAGYTNVILLILCGVVVAHATGNVTHLGQYLAEGDFTRAWRIGGFLV